MKRILVLCGGQSPEHSISIRSCRNILGAIDRAKYSVTLIGISQSGSWRLLEETDLDADVTKQGKEIVIRPGLQDCFWCEGSSLGDFDAVFPVLHGPNGEDGTIQGLLKVLGVPFVGPGVLGSSASMDKDVTKRLLTNAGILVADWSLITRDNVLPSFSQIKDSLGEVVFVKPANMGSSVGVHRVTNDDEWNYAIEDALSYDRKVLVERCIIGRELECAVLGNDHPKASGVGEVDSSNFYSYDEKYASTSEAKITIPALIDPNLLVKLKETALSAYKALDCQGLSRVDMFLTDEGEIYVNEINTIPGFTSISMYPKLWEQEGLGYSKLLDTLIELAIERGV